MSTFGDEFALALVIWREARGEGSPGMQAVGCVVRNRVMARGSSYYAEITRPWQFSSITAKGDPQLGEFPAIGDPVWIECQSFAAGILAGTVADNTGGAQFYYATSIPLPRWAEGMTMTCQIGHQRFYK